MKVYGYTEDKDVVAVHMSAKQMALAGIDPGPLDIFDENPVTIRAGWMSRLLNFRRFQKRSFAYQAGGKVVVGIHSGAENVCLYSNKHRLQDKVLIMEDIKVSEHPMSWHYFEYLQLCETGDFENPWTLRSMLEQGLSLPFRREGDGAVQLQGSTLLLPVSDLDPLEEPHFVGRTLEKVSSATALPERINWVFENFAFLKPVVYGRQLRSRLLGSRCDGSKTGDAVSIAINCDKHMAAMHAFTPYMLEGVPVNYFWRDNCWYNVETRFEGHPSDYFFAIEDGTYSVDWLYSNQANMVTGTRVAFFDLGKRQARVIGANSAETGRAHGFGFTSKRIKSEGLRIVF